MTRSDHDSHQLGGFERRLLDALTILDDGREPVLPVATTATRHRVRRPLVIGAVVVIAGVSIGGAAVAGIISDPPTLQSAVGESVAAGGELIVKGSGCSPEGAVALRVDDGRALGEFNADEEGLFVAAVRIPSHTSLGQHVITAVCPVPGGKVLVQELRLTVTAAEEPIPLDPVLVALSASPGGLAHVKGAGCQPGTEVRVTLDASKPVMAIAGPEGQFLAEFTVPANARLGAHTVKATCVRGDGTDLIQTASLTVVPGEPQPTETKPSR
jgi:hypothetical protein